MANPPAVSLFLTGDPIRLGPDVTSVSAILVALGLGSVPDARVFALAPGAALVAALTGPAGPIVMRWVEFPQAAVLVDGLRPIEVLVVLTAPMRESGRAIRLVSRLAACFRDPRLLEQARGATTRETLVAILASIEETAGESPLAGEDLLAMLASTRAGLSAAEAARRLAICGPNRIERVRRRPLLARFLEQFASFFAVLLWTGGGFAFLAGLPELAWAVFAVIVINGLFSFLQEYRAERAVEALQRLLPPNITVLRDGLEVRLPAAEIVPGDIVRLGEGDHVPADGQLLSAEGLRVDQSPLTGESHPIFKLPSVGDERASVPFVERHELVFAGTGVVAGAGMLVVSATGMGTQIGTIAHLTQAVIETPSPLQREMVRVTQVVTLLAVSFGVSFFVLGVTTGSLSLSQGFLFALGVIVANVPEGLLPTLSLALAIGAQRMARQRSLMKRLSAVETLGAITVICTDKTGTLTRNQMAARFIWLSGRVAEVRDGDDTPADVRELLQAGTLASLALPERGDPTEVAIVAAAARAGVDVEKLRQAHELLAPYPFDSFRKRMTLVRSADAGAVAFVKGAPKECLALCTMVRWAGETVPLSEEFRRTILGDHDRMASEGLRLLAVAVRPLPGALARSAAAAMVERDLTFIGLVAIWDPPQPEVGPAIALCQRAGIRVVMVTGDYGLTAQAIARQVGLPVDTVVTGDEVERMSAEALGELLSGPRVLFARTSPIHKLRIVSILKAQGEVVAVTGDGVNDAPALKAADIGVAMGKRGSEVAKEAAVMVITDDNFASIVSAVRQGRAIYANIGKFVSYIFASNVPELVPFLVFVFAGIPLPLTVMQILAVDLGTDMLPALSLGAEPDEPGVMDRPPRPRNRRLLGLRRLLRAYAFLGLAEALLSMLAFFWTYWVAGWRPGLPMAASGALYHRATTMTLGGIVAAQVGNVFACRTDRESVLRVGLFGNRLLLWSVAGEIGIFLALMLVPPFPAVFGLAPLRFAEWNILLLFPPAMFGFEESRKWIVRTMAAARAKCPPEGSRAE